MQDGAVRVEVEVAAKARLLELLRLGELVRQVLAERHSVDEHSRS